MCDRLSAATGGLLTASAGYAITRGPNLVPSNVLLAQADEALQSAKRGGRGRTDSAATAPSAEEQPSTTLAARNVGASPLPHPANQREPGAKLGSER